MDTPDGPYDRKIQLTGGTTYTVSLPKQWAIAQSVENGDRVRLYDRGDRLLVTQPDDDGSRRTVTASAVRHAPAAIERVLTAAYVAGAEVVRIEGQPDREVRDAVRKAVAGLVGIEVSEETDDAIVARAMLDVDDLSPKQTLAQMESTALRMHEEAISAALNGDAERGRRVRVQDDTVDRLFGLIAREFQRSLVDVRVDGAGSDLTTFDYYTAARQIERVADHAVKIAGTADQIETPPPDDVVDDVTRLGTESRNLVRNALSAMLNDGNAETLCGVLADADRVVDDAESLDRRLYERALPTGYALATVLDSVTPRQRHSDRRVRGQRRGGGDPDDASRSRDQRGLTCGPTDERMSHQHRRPTTDTDRRLTPTDHR
ncbi:PhoU domain-containing protein [Halorubrum sp. DTA98]|uniref:PhoU domain-containing protein n=1 Tax=Halorubrum sp. DTA98 TaxID=3402163 RepID=UPI003AAE11A9